MGKLITSKNYDGIEHALVYDNGDAVMVGDKWKDRDGVEGIIDGARAPHKPSSSGRVFIKYDDGGIREVFATVIDAKWVPFDELEIKTKKIKTKSSSLKKGVDYIDAYGDES